MVEGDGEEVPAEAAASAVLRATERTVGGWRRTRDATAMAAAVAAIETANHELWRLASAQSAYPTMAASVGLLLVEGTGGVYIGVGTPALFRLRDGDLLQMDAASELAPRRVGHGPRIELEVLELELQPGDTYLITTDGLSPALVRPADLRAGMAQAEPLLVAEYLVAVALDRGGVDDATAVAIKVGREAD